jgi:hypothetical protein
MAKKGANAANPKEYLWNKYFNGVNKIKNKKIKFILEWIIPIIVITLIIIVGIALTYKIPNWLDSLEDYSNIKSGDFLIIACPPSKSFTKENNLLVCKVSSSIKKDKFAVYPEFNTSPLLENCDIESYNTNEIIDNEYDTEYKYEFRCKKYDQNRKFNFSIKILCDYNNQLICKTETYEYTI